MTKLRFLLVQIRNADDPIRPQEVGCFATAIGCDIDQLSTLDLLTERVTPKRLAEVDAVLIGGSGDYSAAGQSAWLEGVFADLRMLCEQKKPTFASCWGFQAIARALGGNCIHDPKHAELGTIEMTLTEAGQADAIFGRLKNPFPALAGHEDHVTELPPEAVLLASSATVKNQAFKLPGTLIYCTQFHPELELTTYLERVAAYPKYVEQIAGLSLDSFARQCRETPESRELLRSFTQLVEENQKTTN